MARAGSINYQVSKIIKEHNGIGKSKLEERIINAQKAENGHNISNLIHSYKSLDNIRNDLTNLAKFAKSEFGIKDMKLIDQNVVSSWIDSKDITYNTASNYLSELNKVVEHLNVSKSEIKDLRAELKDSLSNKQLTTRAYKDLDKVVLPEKGQVAFELQRDYGLRMSAATHINIEKQIKGNTLFYKEKGGKQSEKELTPALITKIKENAVNGVYTHSINTYRDQLQKEIEKTGQKYNGTHGIRHTYAQNQLLAGKSKLEVSKEMGHVREEITNVYLR